MILTLALAASLAQQAAAAPPAGRRSTCRSGSSTRGAARSSTSSRWWRRWQRPTWSWSASSTTIRNTHRLEYALVSGLQRRRVAPTVSLEMFERDVQEVDRPLSLRGDRRRAAVEGGTALAALRDRLQAARRTGEERGLAGGRRQRAAALRVRDRQDGRSRASASCPRPTGRWWPGSSSARTMPTSTGSRAR